MNPKEQRTFDALKTLFEYVSNAVQEPLGPRVDAGLPHLDQSAPNDTFLCRGTWRRTEPFIAAVKAALRGAPTLPAFIEQASADRVLQIHSKAPGAPLEPLNTFEADTAVEDLWPYYLQFLEQEGRRADVRPSI